MARSHAIYVVVNEAGVLIAGFTVKHECATWCGQVFSEAPREPNQYTTQTIWLGRAAAATHRVLRLPDKPSPFTGTYDKEGHNQPTDMGPVSDWID